MSEEARAVMGGDSSLTINERAMVEVIASKAKQNTEEFADRARIDLFLWAVAGLVKKHEGEHVDNLILWSKNTEEFKNLITVFHVSDETIRTFVTKMKDGFSTLKIK